MSEGSMAAIAISISSVENGMLQCESKKIKTCNSKNENACIQQPKSHKFSMTNEDDNTCS